MFGWLSQIGFRQLRPALDALDSGFDYGGGGGGGGYSPPAPVSAPAASTSAPAPAPGPSFDFDLSAASIARAQAKGNTEADIRSAYEVFTTGYSKGRGMTYAQDIQRRFSAGLMQTYGSADIRTAAANYLDSAGLMRLAPPPPPVEEPKWEGPKLDDELQIEDQFFGNDPYLDPEPGPDTNGVVTQKEQEGPGDPFETIADVFERMFAVNATDAAPAPVVVVGDATQGQAAGGGGMGLILVLVLGGGLAFYWFYLRKKMGGDGNG